MRKAARARTSRSLGGVYGAVEKLRHLGHGQVVHVAQREREAMRRRQLLQHAMRAQQLEALLPRVAMLGAKAGHGVKATRLARTAPPMVDELVPGDPDEPGSAHRRRVIPANRFDRREERYRGQVLGKGGRAAARQQVPVHGRQRPLVDVEQRLGGVGGGLWHPGHILIVVRGTASPTRCAGPITSSLAAYAVARAPPPARAVAIAIPQRRQARQKLKEQCVTPWCATHPALGGAIAAKTLPSLIRRLIRYLAEHG